MGTNLGRVAVVARFKPVHAGHAAMLRAVAARSSELTIGLGSCNRYNMRNPFTAAESAEMIRLALGEPAQRCRLIEIPDLDDGPRWKEMVRGLLGELDLFVTANPYVRSLMQEHYKVVHPLLLIPVEEQVPVDGTMVRTAMARGESWLHLVPDIVSQYIVQNGLDVRFKKEFGLAALAQELEPPVSTDNNNGQAGTPAPTGKKE